jgi:hypothetical protein
VTDKVGDWLVLGGLADQFAKRSTLRIRRGLFESGVEIDAATGQYMGEQNFGREPRFIDAARFEVRLGPGQQFSYGPIVRRGRRRAGMTVSSTILPLRQAVA